MSPAPSRRPRLPPAANGARDVRVWVSALAVTLPALGFMSAARAASPPAPADCPTTPDESAPPIAPGGVTLLPVLPGVGMAAIPLSPEALAPQTCIPASPPLPQDVLHGDPDGNLLDDRGRAVLEGPPGDVLRGP